MGKKKKNATGKPSPRVRRASEVNQTVERMLGEAAEITTTMRDIPGFLEVSAHLRRGLTPVWPREAEAKMTFSERVSVGDLAARTAMVDLWKRNGRVAYDVHPEMAAQLYKSNLKGKLPGELFQRVPHINPLIPLPHPWPYEPGKGRGQKGLIRAFYLTGVTANSLCTTTDSRSEGLAVMPWINLYDEETGGYDDTVTPLLPLPATNTTFTFDDAIDHINGWHGTRTDSGDRALMRQILPGALSLLTYLCCDNRDMEEPPRPPATGKRRQAPSRDPFYIRVGWYIGPKLHAARIRAEGRVRDGVSVPSGTEQGPQHRVGHYRRVHHGPRTKSRTSWEWIKPYWTKLDMLEEGAEPVTQVVPVDPQVRDPSGHRDVKLANLGTEKAKEIRERERQRAREDNWDF